MKSAKMLDGLISQIITELNLSAPDDELQDLIEDADSRLEAMEYLHEKLGKMIREY